MLFAGLVTSGAPPRPAPRRLCASRRGQRPPRGCRNSKRTFEYAGLVSSGRVRAMPLCNGICVQRGRDEVERGRRCHLLLVAPEDRGASLHLRLAQHQVKVHDLVFSMITHKHKQPTLPELHRVLDELPHPRVHLFPDHVDLDCKIPGRRHQNIHEVKVRRFRQFRPKESFK